MSVRYSKALVVAVVLFGVGRAFPCSAVFLESAVVFNRLEGSLLQYGRVWPNATLALYPGLNYSPQGRTEPAKRVTSDENGRFDFGEVAKGKYTVVVLEGHEYRASESIAVLKDRRPMRTSMLIDYRRTTPDCKEMTRVNATTVLPNKYLMQH